MSACDFEVRKENLRETRFTTAPAAEPEPGEALLRVEKFGFTSNNVTYGAVGEAIGYWNFFPAEPGWGRIPVWGIAVVERSRNDALPEGERLYGYLPMSTHLRIRPEHVGRGGLIDGAAHRSALPPVYNQYVRLAHEPGYEPSHDDRRMVLQPLLATAFLIDDFLAENDFFGARAVVLASASSKTAFSLAYFLSRRGGIEVIGLTSPGNAAFVEGLGFYDRVVPYGKIAALQADLPIVYVDMAGNAQVTRDVHQHFGDAVRHSCLVGLTHWEHGGSLDGLPGAKPAFFFAPTHIEKRRQDWGRDEFQSRLAAASRDLFAATESSIRIVHGRGRNAVEEVYRDALEGRMRPDEGHVLTLRD
jgi:hypothetical protein